MSEQEIIIRKSAELKLMIGLALSLEECETFIKDVLEAQEQVNVTLDSVRKRFSINKTVLSDFALFAIIDNEQKKVVCHLVYDNGEQYCDEMANKMLVGLNGC